MSTRKSGSKSTRSRKVSRGTRSSSSTSADNTRIAAAAMITGDQFVMNGQKPAAVMESRTWTSNSTGESFTNVVMRRSDGGIMTKQFDPSHKVLIVRNDKLDASRKAIASANMTTV